MKASKKFAMTLVINACLSSSVLLANPTQHMSRGLWAAAVVGGADMVIMNGYYQRYLKPETRLDEEGRERVFQRRLIDVVTPGLSALGAFNLVGGTSGVSLLRNAARTSVRSALYTGSMITSGLIYAGGSAVGHYLAARDSKPSDDTSHTLR